MKERPILFSTPMVQAILEGRKTQTRRVVKPQPPYDLPYCDSKGSCLWAETGDEGDGWWPDNPKDCPCGQPGDRLWVRETWKWADGGASGFRYRAEGELKRVGKWKPSIHMPRIASRITLEITAVRVERLQSISEEDAVAEGTGSGFQMNAGWPDYTHIKNGVCEVTQDSASMSYATLWETINGPGSWDKNPWVWVVEFKRVTPEVAKS